MAHYALKQLLKHSLLCHTAAHAAPNLLLRLLLLLLLLLLPLPLSQLLPLPTRALPLLLLLLLLLCCCFCFMYSTYVQALCAPVGRLLMGRLHLLP
jgi:hypothetical protein